MTIFDLTLNGAFFLLSGLAALRDYKRRRIDNCLIILLLACGCAACFAPADSILHFPLWYRLAGFAIIIMIAVSMWHIAPQQLGGGDVKLLAAAALFLGIYHLAFVLILMTLFLLVVCWVKHAAAAIHVPFATYFFPAYCLSLIPIILILFTD